MKKNPETGNTPYTSTGHGHVWPRADGVKARCEGAAFCKLCRNDRDWIIKQMPKALREVLKSASQSATLLRQLNFHRHAEPIESLIAAVVSQSSGP